MDIDLEALVQNVEICLIAAMPYLVKTGEAAAEEVGTHIGSESWQLAKRLWQKLRPSVSAKPALEDAIRDVANAPEGEAEKLVLRGHLMKLLSEDTTLANEVAQLLGLDSETKMPTAIVTGDKCIVIQRDVMGGVLWTGNFKQK